MAGVIGCHKPQFSLIGDTVNTASRVCSNSDENKVTISQEAFERVSNCEYLFNARDVYAKGKNIIRIYDVVQKL